MSVDIVGAFDALMQQLGPLTDLANLDGDIKARRVVIQRHATEAREVGEAALEPWIRFLAREEERIAHAGDVMLVQAAIAVAAQHPVTVAAEQWLTSTKWDKPYFRLLNRPSGRGPREPLEIYSGPNGALALHPDGNRFVSALGNTIWLWSRRDGTPIRKIRTDLRGAIYRLAIHPDGFRVFAGCLSDAEDEEEPDGRVLAFDLESGKRIATYAPHEKASTGFFDLSQDGRWIVSAGEHSLHLWEVDAKAKNRQIRARWALKGNYGIAGLHPNREWVVAWNLGHIEIRSTADGKLIRSFPISGAEASDVGSVNPVFLKDGRRTLWTFGGDMFAEIDLQAGDVVDWFSGHTNELTSLSISDDETRILTSSQDGTFRIFDFATGNSLHVNGEERDTVYAACFVDGEQRVMASSGRDRVCVWDVPQGEDAITIDPPCDNLLGCAITRDERRVLTLHSDQKVRIWDPGTGRCLHEVDLIPGLSKAYLSTSPDDRDGVVASLQGPEVGVFKIDAPSEVEARRIKRWDALDDDAGHGVFTKLPIDTHALTQVPNGVALRTSDEAAIVYRLHGESVKKKTISDPEDEMDYAILATFDGQLYVVALGSIVQVVRVGDWGHVRRAKVPRVMKKTSYVDTKSFVAHRFGTEEVYFATSGNVIHRTKLNAKINDEVLERIADLPAEEEIRALAFPKSGASLLVECMQALHLYDPDTGSRRATFRYEEPNLLNSVAFLHWTRAGTIVVRRGRADSGQVPARGGHFCLFQLVHNGREGS